MSKTTYQTDEKIVIVAGPSFGQALKFMLLGAVLGAGAVTYLKPKTTALPQPRRGAKGMVQDLAMGFIASKFDPHKPGTPKTEAAKNEAAKFEASIEEISANSTGEELSDDVADRMESLTSRLKSIGARAKQLVETAGEAVKPTLETAIAEGKRVASEVQSNLKKDVVEAGDSPAIAKEDGELPSEKENKFIE